MVAIFSIWRRLARFQLSSIGYFLLFGCFCCRYCCCCRFIIAGSIWIIACNTLDADDFEPILPTRTEHRKSVEYSKRNEKDVHIVFIPFFHPSKFWCPKGNKQHQCACRAKHQKSPVPLYAMSRPTKVIYLHVKYLNNYFFYLKIRPSCDCSHGQEGILCLNNDSFKIHQIRHIFGPP